MNKKYGKSVLDGGSLFSIWQDAKGRRVKFVCIVQNPGPDTSIILYLGSKKEIAEIKKEREKLDIESSDPSGL